MLGTLFSATSAGTIIATDMKSAASCLDRKQLARNARLELRRMLSNTVNRISFAHDVQKERTLPTGLERICDDQPVSKSATRRFRPGPGSTISRARGMRGMRQGHS